MPETPYVKFRLGADTLADINALAASNGGNNTLAVKEALGQFRALVAAPARRRGTKMRKKEAPKTPQIIGVFEYFGDSRGIPETICPE